MSETETDPKVEALAAVLDPDVFDDDKPKSTREAALIQWAARRYMATEKAERAIAAGWVSPEEATAREAAARREALLESERLQTMLNSMDHFAEVAERCEAKSNEYAAKIARVEALADAAEATAVGPPFVFTRDLRAALAEPERDEESAEGSCKPGTCDAPVMCSTDAPCPRDEEGGR